MASKRSYKLQEFVAHTSNVNCLRIGPKSGRVLATGGEDRKVNIWAIGKPNVIMTLTGHNSSIDSVAFDMEEHYVVSGSAGGSLRLWDLGEAKVVRNFSGHKSNCTSVDFHPYGDFFASGSMDTNLKVWDIRRKGCIFTYKGHTKAINAIKFSPDGRWVVSAGEDGTTKIWDLTNGKLLKDLTSHTAAVTSVDFHPNEFLLATGSADKTTKIWDLETFDLISTSDLDATRIRNVKFTSDGSCLLSSTSENMKVLGWEPSICYDSVPMGWNHIQDMSVNKDQVVGCSIQQSFVSVWVVNLQKVAPFCVNEENEAPANPINTPISVPSRAPVNQARGTTPSHHWNAIDQNTLTSMKKMQLTPDEPASQPQGMTSHPSVGALPLSTAAPAPAPAQRRPRDFSRPSSSQEPSSARPSSTDLRVNHTAIEGLERKEDKRVDSPSAVAFSSSGQHVSQGVGGTAKFSDDVADPSNIANIRDNFSRPAPHYTSASPQHVSVSGRRSSSANSNRPSSRNSNQTPSQEKPAYLEYFQKGLEQPKQSEQVYRDDNSIIESISTASDTMCQIMRQRLLHVQSVRVLWITGDARGAIDALLKQKDVAVIRDFVHQLNQNARNYTLELCGMVVPLLKELLTHQFENYILTGLQSAQVLLRNFGPVIQQTRESAPYAGGVDIVREERLRKCNVCFDEFSNIVGVVRELEKKGGRIGDEAQSVSMSMKGFLRI